MNKPLIGARLNHAHPLAAGLAGCWLFNEIGSSAADDLSRNGNNGTWPSGATWTSGLFGPLLKLAAAGAQHVSFGAPALLSFDRQNPFSIRLRLVTSDATRGTIFSKESGAPPYCGYSVVMVSGTLYWILQQDYASNLIQIHSSRTINDGNEHDLCFTYNGSSKAAGLKIYIDGKLDPPIIDGDSLSASIGNGAAVWCNGFGSDYNPKDYATIALSLVAVYSRALSQAEAAWHAQEPFGLFARPAPFVDWKPAAAALPHRIMPETLALFPLTGIH
jgi:hypothetical protein